MIYLQTDCEDMMNKLLLIRSFKVEINQDFNLKQTQLNPHNIKHSADFIWPIEGVKTDVILNDNHNLQLLQDLNMHCKKTMNLQSKATFNAWDVINISDSKI